MAKKHSILLSAIVLLLLALVFFIIVSQHGFADLLSLKEDQNRLVEENKRLRQENVSIGIEIDRLKDDPVYIESIARQELGMIGADEIILKSQNRAGRGK